jgi:MoaA/NifB/PqqE/SkfB family radical SAM enzyme
MSAVNFSEAKENKNFLSIETKMKILRILAENNVKIDFSGGDPLYYEDDFLVVEEATKLLPREMIDVSMTGINFTPQKLALIKKVGKVEISIDNPPETINECRPRGFNASAISILKKLIEAGVFCSGVTTLYPETAKEENLRALYKILCENKIPKWNILRYYLIGKGASMSGLHLSDQKLLSIMDILDSFTGYTEIAFQHSLMLLRGDYQCHAGNKAIGILPDGTVVACGWGLDANSCALPGFELGKLPQDNFGDMLKKAKTELGYGKRVNYCRVMNCLEGDKGHEHK